LSASLRRRMRPERFDPNHNQVTREYAGSRAPVPV
jgi:hypothetical protein